MRGKRLLLAGSALVLGALSWPVATSAAFQRAAPWATGPSLDNPAPAYFYWRDYRQTAAVRRWMPPCAAGAGLLCLLPAGLILFVRSSRRLEEGNPGDPVPEPIRARSDMHGSAHWMLPDEVPLLFPGQAPGHGGVVIGETASGELIVDPCTDDATHGLLFSGSGGGKTAGAVIPTLDPKAGWSASVVVFDPSCEVARKTRDMREEIGQRVVTLAPGGQGFNVLDWIDLNDPLADAHVLTIVDMIGPEERKGGDNPIFPQQAMNLQVCILADLLWDDTLLRCNRTLKEFVFRMSLPEPEMRERLNIIYQHSKSPMAARLGGKLMSIHPKTFSSVYSTAQADIRWLEIGAYADMVSGGDMRTDDLGRGDLTVYVQIPLATLQDTPELGRTVINALRQGVYRHEGRMANRVLFLLDEINLLGKMKALAVARDNARKYQITLIGMWQSLGQIIDTWGEGGKSAWIESSSWQAFSAVSDPATAEEISKRAGTYTVLSRTESASRGSSSGKAGSSNRGKNIGQGEQARLLIRPDEVTTKVGKTERIVFRKGGSGPLRCESAMWFRRPEMLTRVRDEVRPG